MPRRSIRINSLHLLQMTVVAVVLFMCWVSVELVCLAVGCFE